MARPFVDEVEVIVQGGDGGDGCTAFERQPYNARGGPSGGDGGTGGSIIIQASPEKNTLSDFSKAKILRAEPGRRGGPSQKKGRSGENLVVKVPPGTMIYNAKTESLIGELTEPGEALTVVRGGAGGRGNRCFKSSRRQRPRFHELGGSGEKKKLRLELRLVADVGLIGLPNSGKSTLLNSLTAAHPEMADYPFTTINPNLGVLEDDFKRLVLCDIPGLVSDAHAGAGLGIKFLRHIDRTSILVHLIDMASRTPVDAFYAIRKELQEYNPQLLRKPTIIALNKIDLIDPEEIKIFAEDITPAPGPLIGISAKEKINLDALVEELWKLYENRQEIATTETAEEKERVVRLESRKPLAVTRVGDRYVLEGGRVEKLVNRFDLNNRDALNYVRNQLLDIGLHKVLEQAGCKPGDTVQIDDREFEYTG